MTLDLFCLQVHTIPLMDHFSFQAVVLHGDQSGKRLGFPTLNFSFQLWPKGQRLGVYTSTVMIGGRKYAGVLYAGPRYIHSERFDILEIHVLDFAQDIYDTQVQVELGQFLRPPFATKTLSALIELIEKDCKRTEAWWQNQTQPV